MAEWLLLDGVGALSKLFLVFETNNGASDSSDMCEHRSAQLVPWRYKSCGTPSFIYTYIQSPNHSLDQLSGPNLGANISCRSISIAFATSH